MNNDPKGQLFQNEQTDKTAHPKMISIYFLKKRKCDVKKGHYLPVKVAHLVQVINGDGHLCQVKPGHVFLQLVSMSKQTQHIHTATEEISFISQRPVPIPRASDCIFKNFKYSASSIQISRWYLKIIYAPKSPY